MDAAGNLSQAAELFSRSYNSYPEPQAVMEINEHTWVDDRREEIGGLGTAFDEYLGVDVLEGYAPHAVFFEGWQSTPRNDIVDYAWDFGAGTESDEGGRYFHGLNAAHVYETPGTYTVTLTVTNKFDRTSSVTYPQDIVVHAPDGRHLLRGLRHRRR